MRVSEDLRNDKIKMLSLSAEVDRLREAIKEITLEAHHAFQLGEQLTYSEICKWSNQALGEPSLDDLKNKRTGQ